MSIKAAREIKQNKNVKQSQKQRQCVACSGALTLAYLLQTLKCDENPDNYIKVSESADTKPSTIGVFGGWKVQGGKLPLV